MKLKKNKIALIFGVTGQDGSYLSRLLLEKGYQVHGVKEEALLSIQKDSMIFIKTFMRLKIFFFITVI